MRLLPNPYSERTGHRENRPPYCRNVTPITICSSATCSTPFPRTIWRVWSIPSFLWPRRPTQGFRYEHKNVLVESAPSVRGLPTIYDKDSLIYCSSQVMGKKPAGEPLAQTLHLNAH